MSAGGQQDSCRQRTIPVSIFGVDGSPVPLLSSANLEGSYRKKPVAVTGAVINREPPRVVLLLDASASMHGPRSQHDLNFSVDLAEDLLSGMPSASEVGLGFFSEELEPIARPTSDRKTLIYQLEGLRSNPSSSRGKTALWAAIFDSVKMFERPRLGDAIYVITDGGDNLSHITAKDVARTLGEASVRLFAFVFQRERDSAATSPEERTGPAIVHQVVDDTGGTIVGYEGDSFGVFTKSHDSAFVGKSGKPTRLGSLLGSQYRQLSSFYRVDIDLPETLDKPQKWELDLTGFGKSERDKLVLRYPHMLVPCH